MKEKFHKKKISLEKNFENRCKKMRVEIILLLLKFLFQIFFKQFLFLNRQSFYFIYMLIILEIKFQIFGLINKKLFKNFFLMIIVKCN